MGGHICLSSRGNGLTAVLGVRVEYLGIGAADEIRMAAWPAANPD